MRSIGIKLTVSAVIALMIVASMPFIGLTESSRDSKEGLVLDFGYWNIEWIDMSFTPGMDGFGALEEACHIKGYSVTRLEDGTVHCTTAHQASWASFSGRLTVDGKVGSAEDCTAGVIAAVAVVSALSLAFIIVRKRRKAQ